MVEHLRIRAQMPGRRILQSKEEVELAVHLVEGVGER